MNLPKDKWEELISEGYILELLLGAQKEFFKPADSKSPNTASYYRWYHDRYFIVERIFDYYDGLKDFGELQRCLGAAIKHFKDSDKFVWLMTIFDIASVLFYSYESGTNRNDQQIYKQLHGILKDNFNQIKIDPEILKSVPESYPGDMSTVLLSIEKYISKLDEVYL